MYLILDIYNNTYGLFEDKKQAEDIVLSLYEKDMDAGDFQQAKYIIACVEIKTTKDIFF